MSRSDATQASQAGHTGDTRITFRDVLHPANLPIWIGVALLRLLVLLPWRAQMRLGISLGRAFRALARGRRHIAATNLALCFPDLDPATRKRMLHDHFDAVGLSVMEMAITWWRPQDWFARRCEIEGREQVDAALAQGRGILMLTPHYTALDIAGMGATASIPMHANFDPPSNPLFSKLLQRGRLRHVESLLDNRDVRGIVRTLRNNEIMFFAPDQTVRRNRAGVSVPFFGIPTMTTTGTSRLARISRAPVMTMLLLRKPDLSGYRIRFLPALENFPSENIEADTERVNAHIAACIRSNEPAQYLWLHQRFKRGSKGAGDNPYDPRSGRKLPPIGYRRLSLLLAPVLNAHVWIRSLRDGGAVFRRQRRGHAYPATAPAPYWLHAASVGEVVTAAPLLRALQAAGRQPLLLTTGTPTGLTIARKLVDDDCTVAYLPIDRPRPVDRFLEHFRPQAALIIETELWPWLFAALRNRHIPTLVINGRLSARSLRARGGIRDGIRFCIRKSRTILARSDEDAARFRTLGAQDSQIRVVGNLKHAAGKADDVVPIELGRRYALAASTHDDEEMQLAEAWQQARPANRLLVIAPRHPERGERLARALRRRGLVVSRRSLKETVTPATEIYLADTLGELPQLCAGAEAVFMGGSLIRHGGQNVLEPARLGRAVITGYHTNNFEEETALLEAAGGLLRAADAAEAVTHLLALMDDPARRSATGQAARDAMAGNADIVQRYLQAIDAALASETAPTQVRS